ncbi:MAG: antirepressor protein KilAC domain [Bacteriophage sp.]|nr:MAG: antirepressor protein KilAC domain [Bacteriophage sp.]
MNTEIQTFNFDSASLRTLTDENGDPWFVGKDVATILGYANPRKALIDHVDDEDKTDGVTIRDSIGREQNPTVINESGLYSLILSSKLSTAKRFKRWVTHEVLPTIRKTGGYIPASEADSDEDILAKAVLIAQKTIDLKNQQLKAKDAQIKELEPKAQALDAFTDVEDRLLVRDAAKVLSNAGTPISEKQLREWMTANDWIYKHNGSWHATARHCTAGHLVMVMSTKHGTKADGTKFAFPPTVRITRRGLTLLHQRLSESILTKTFETTSH